MSIIGKVGRAIKQGIYQRTDRNLFNGYTGLKEGKLAAPLSIAAIGGSFAFHTSGALSSDPKSMDAMENRLYMSDVLQIGPSITKARLKSIPADYVGEAPMMRTDAVTNAPTLGATGSMVFGLHNMRRG